VKRCRICGEIKDLDDFYKCAGMADGHRHDCKVCNLAARKAKYIENPAPYIARVKRWQQENSERVNEYRREYRRRPDRQRADRDGHLRRKYGITLADYERMFEAQGGVCAICGESRPEDRTLHIDHDHKSGEVRGLLCFRCNNSLGDLRENYDLFQCAADYLDRDDALAALARTRVKALTD
jgi:hypothetical protein